MTPPVMVVRVRRALGAIVEGPAVVSKEGFSPRYDLDRTTGVISKIGHALEGVQLRDKILVLPSAKGGVAAGWAFLDIKAKGLAPKALVFGKTNPVMVQGAVLAEMTLTEGWEPSALEVIRTGDIVRIEPSERVIHIIERRTSRATPSR